MSLTFSCPTCQKTYEVTIMGTRFSYICDAGNNHRKVLTLKHEDDDCFVCQEEILEAEHKARAQVKQKTMLY